MSSYSECTTSITFGKITIPGIKLNRGVKQGDPSSPILFNMILNELLDLLPEDIGVKLTTKNFNNLAFADDLILLSQTSARMILRIRTMERFFMHRSLQINVKKCFSLVLTTTVKHCAPFLIKESSYQISGLPVKATNYGECFKYLGIRYDPNGKMKPNIEFIDTMLKRLKRAPLKPHQKLALLRTNVLPKLNHQLVLGRITKGLLSSFDLKIRDFIKEIILLPNDTPSSFIYAKVNAGGLRVTPLADNVPISIINRFVKFKNSSDLITKELASLSCTESLITACFRMINIEPTDDIASLRDEVTERNLKILHSTVDGAALKEFSKNTDCQQWVYGTSNIINSRVYRNLIKLRIGRLATKENCNRGRRDANKQCRHCLRVQETQTHVLQNCHFTHFNRMRRHDRICDWVKAECELHHMTVSWEPKIEIQPDFKIKPGLIIETGLYKQTVINTSVKKRREDDLIIRNTEF